MAKQLELSPEKVIIETVVITPNKTMPFEMFEKFHHFAYFSELMERTPDGKIIWDQSVTSIVSENAARAEYYAMQNDYFTMDLEVPKAWVE